MPGWPFVGYHNNIVSVVQNGVTTSYSYDGLGQLIRVVDGQEGANWEYTYDQGGNILTKKKYMNGVETESMNLENTNENWRDQLTKVNGTTITYDKIGNPLSDGTWTYTWQNGRQLQKMQKSGETVEFVYNENGLRVQKTATSTGVTKYTLHGKNIVHMTQGNNELHFFYDASSKPAIVVFNGTPYSYVKNLQGDIMAILNSAGTIVVNYVYDAWGNPISKTGTMAGTLGTVQPFRYRGYVYDEETGFYQLRNRYYSPNRNRFISSDNQLHKLMIPLSQNLYAYCFNRVISFADSNGNDAYWITDDQAAHQAGHTSLLLEDADGNWFYYYWGPDAGENPLGGDAYIKFDPITLTFDENGDLDLRALNETLIHNYGADAPAASHYDNALLFEGDFTKSIPVAQDLVQRESQHNGVEYRLFGDNCMQTSAAILSASLNAYDSFLLDLALIPTAPRLCRFYVWIFADDSIDLQKDE